MIKYVDHDEQKKISPNHFPQDSSHFVCPDQITGQLDQANGSISPIFLLVQCLVSNLVLDNEELFRE